MPCFDMGSPAKLWPEGFRDYHIRTQQTFIVEEFLESNICDATYFGILISTGSVITACQDEAVKGMGNAHPAIALFDF